MGKVYPAPQKATGVNQWCGVYKDKKSKGCALCKPHKHGWAPKKKPRVRAYEKEKDKEIKYAISHSGIIHE